MQGTNYSSILFTKLLTRSQFQESQMEWEGYSLQTEEVKQRLGEGEYKGNILETLILIQPHFPSFGRSMHC